MKYQTSAALLLSALLLIGCANKSGARMGLFSATAPVVAIMAGDLFVGEAEGYASGSGRIEARSTVNPNVRCMGRFNYKSNSHGTGVMRCNDGAEASFDFKSLSMLSGYGIGTSSRGPFSFTYGLTADQAEKYLVLPTNKKLEKSGGKLSLIDI